MKVSNEGLEEDGGEMKRLIEENRRLLKENANFRYDNIYKLFFATNRKSGEIADALNESEISFTGDDKVFDRFMKLIEKLEPLARTLAWLRQEYLKIPEDQIEEAELKGVPPIERRAKSNNKK